MSKVLVVAEVLEGRSAPINQEMFTAAAKIAKELGGSAMALFLGADAAALSTEAGKYGIGKAVVVEDPKVHQFSPDCHAAAIAAVVRETRATVVLMGATAIGKDVMPRVAMLLESALAQDCTAYRVDGGQLFFTRPMYAGKVFAQVRITGSPVMATLRPRACKPEEHAVSVSVEKLSPELPEPLAMVEAWEKAEGDRLDVTQADIVVSGGRGLRGPENWHLIENLARVLGAATGCSRPVSDEGWRPHDEHVGQTGKTVSPNLYIACGISGAIQHVAGISSSKYILAINKDPEAPIFKVADYGIVGDVFEVLPALTEEIKKLKAGQ